MNTREIARGGLLAGFAVVLLYIAALIPQAAPALCISAGIVTALPLLRSRTVKGSVTVYAAVSALSVILVPRKSIAAAYIMATGLYPIVKFLIENRTRPMVQMAAQARLREPRVRRHGNAGFEGNLSDDTGAGLCGACSSGGGERRIYRVRCCADAVYPLSAAIPAKALTFPHTRCDIYEFPEGEAVK